MLVMTLTRQRRKRRALARWSSCCLGIPRSACCPRATCCHTLADALSPCGPNSLPEKMGKALAGPLTSLGQCWG